jgi:multidrug efflux system outer membrane protein
MMRPLSASMLALALAGCVNMAPAHERPSLASAPAYDGEYRPDGTVVASTLPYGEWFDDARLVAPPWPVPLPDAAAPRPGRQ